MDRVLNEVRPYLISDGGNVAVHAVDTSTRSVQLILEGACGSCPSSTTTMKMGIERVLNEKFADLSEVVDVTQEVPPYSPYPKPSSDAARIRPARERRPRCRWARRPLRS